MRSFLRRFRRPVTCPPLRRDVLRPEAPAAHYDPRAWYHATYSRRSDWHRSARWQRISR